MMESTVILYVVYSMWPTLIGWNIDELEGKHDWTGSVILVYY